MADSESITLTFTPQEIEVLFNALVRQPYLLGDATLISPIVNKIFAVKPKKEEPHNNGPVQQ